MDFEEKVRKIVGAPEPAATTAAPAGKPPPGGLPAELAWYARKAGVKIVLPQAAGEEATPPSRGLGIILLGSLCAVVLLLAGGLAWALLGAAAPPASPATDAVASAGSPDMPASVAELPPTNPTGNYAQNDPTPSPASPAADNPAAAAGQTASVAGDTAFLEGQSAAARTALEEQMPEPRGLVYRDVETIVASSNGAQSVNFCGNVNSRDPMGAYIGYQRFISSADHAQVERSMTPGEFSQAWRDRCSGASGPQIWK